MGHPHRYHSHLVWQGSTAVGCYIANSLRAEVVLDPAAGASPGRCPPMTSGAPVH